MSKSKKIVSALLASSLFATSLFSATAISNTTQNKKYSAFQTSYIKENGERVNKIDYSSETVNSKARSVLPASYNSADYGYVTSVKNQGNTGTCWAYAAISAIESSLIKNNGYPIDTDLSEFHLAYGSFNTKYDKLGLLDSKVDLSGVNFLNFGGDDSDPMFTLANWQGVVSDDFNNGQFSNEKMHLMNMNLFKVYNTEAMYDSNEAIMTDCYRVPFSNPDLVKQYIMEYGSGSMSINASGSFENYDYSSYYCYESDINYVNHAVAVVGWNDNYPKENFTVNGYTPKNDGGWLIKNSYSEYAGEDGYYWVSYDDCSITNFPAEFYALDTTNKYDNSYQYDDLVYEQVLCDNKNTVGINSDGYMANVYTAQNTNEKLTAVAFVTSSADIDYKIDVYTNVTSTPTDGVLSASVSGNMSVAGYHTVDLETPVSLTNGEKFAVVVYLGDSDNPERTMLFNIDGNNTQFRPWAVKNSDYGESFFSYDGKNWDDLKESLDGNFRIKALTTSDENEAPKQDYYNSFNGKDRNELIDNLSTEMSKCVNVLSNKFNYSNDTYNDFINKFVYAQTASFDTDLFQAIELYYITEELKDAYTKLMPYSYEDTLAYYYNTIVENVEYYDSIPLWESFISTYNSALEQSKTLEANKENEDYLKSIIEPVFMEYMTYAVNHGSMNSNLQKYGDVDNSSDINIQDVTLTQMYIAKLKNNDFYIDNNADVDGDGEITIKDATYIQMMVSQYIDHFTVYDKDFSNDIYNVDSPKEEITYDVAIAKLETAVNFGKYDIDLRPSKKYDNLLKVCLYEDANKVLENPTEYSPEELNFKATYLIYILYNVV